MLLFKRGRVIGRSAPELEVEIEVDATWSLEE
jgi:hypothetical protein